MFPELFLKRNKNIKKKKFILLFNLYKLQAQINFFCALNTHRTHRSYQGKKKKSYFINVPPHDAILVLSALKALKMISININIRDSYVEL